MSGNLVQKLSDHVRREGVASAVGKAIRWPIVAIRGKDPIDRHRQALSEGFAKKYGNVVLHGPFKGLKLAENSWWGGADKPSMLLGLYEQEVLDALAGLADPDMVLIDLGAADGYYGVGVLVNGMFRKSYCFEMSALGRETIAANAALNGVADRVVIKGTADSLFYQSVAPEDLKKAVLLVDIEGAEFDLLDRPVFAAFAHSTILIELHDWMLPDGNEKLAKLMAAASATHKGRAIMMGARDPSRYPELHDYTDSDRWLICSEGRARLMSWLRLDPKHPA